ncbi:MAG: alpha-amylase family glycosyl hydrolase [bacterium]
MAVVIERDAPQEVSSVDIKPRGRIYPSPATWRDQILYFLLPDRFSDGGEGHRPLFDRTNPDVFKTRDKRSWMEGGRRFQGGTITGIESKLDYLKGLGVTTLWIGPIWRQRPDLETYHGYGIQNFLDIDPRFGTRQDLRDLVDAAHDRDMYVILDIIYNHTGNNWFYKSNGYPVADIDYRFEPPYPFGGWRSRQGECIDSISTLDDGVWPREFQNRDWYTRAGRINHWDPQPWEDPMNPNNEFRRGDFFDLKDLDLSDWDSGKNREILNAISRAYQYWIALSDCDGFRIDTLKHVPLEASRKFCGAIHEYAESIGKENFLLLGEVAGSGEMVHNYLGIFGQNIDAALDIGVPPNILAAMVKGFGDPAGFFNQFRGGGQDILGSHRELGRYHVSILDDHDMVTRNGKHRFAANAPIPGIYQQVAHAVGVQLTTLGIPCIYYGTEQAFDGTQNRHDPSVDSGFEDRYIRESMFGGTFGAFETSGCHFFNPDHPTYLRIAALSRVRGRNDLIGRTLRRGRQYFRQTSVQGRPFSFPGGGELVAWSRILLNQEVIIALNTNGIQSRGADITVDSSLHPVNSAVSVFYRGDWSDAELKNPPTGRTIPVQSAQDGRASIRIDLPPAGMAVLG